MSNNKLSPREELRRNLKKRWEKHNVIALANYSRKRKKLPVKTEGEKSVCSAEILLFLGVQYDRKNQSAFCKTQDLTKRWQETSKQRVEVGGC